MLKSWCVRTAFVVVSFMCFADRTLSHGEDSSYPLLTNLTDIRVLPQAEARKGYPVEIKALVTCFDPSLSAVALQSGDEAIYARYPAGETLLRPGDEVVLKGFTLAADHNYVAASTVTITSKRVALPEPLVLFGDRLFDIKFDCMRATTTGVVERVKVDGAKWMFSVRQNGREFLAQLVRPPRATLDPRDWLGARVQFTGPASIRRAPGEPAVTRFFCPTISEVRVIDPPGAPQRVKIADLNKWTQIDHWLTVTGRVSAIVPLITVKDETGEIPLPFVPFARAGDEIELTGFAVTTNGFASLTAVEAGIIERDAKGQRRRLLTSIAQVRGLAATEAENHLPVRLRGVVTYSEGAKFFFMHDGANGIFVWPENPQPEMRVGKEIEIVGKAGPGMFAPIVEAASITVGRRIELPAPKPVTLSDLISGREDSALVEIAGVVRHVYLKEDRSELEIATAGGKLTARVACPLEMAQPLENASVRVSGVASGHFNERHQIVAAVLFVPDLDSIHIEEKPAMDPFSIKRTRLHDVFRYREGADLTRRVLVSGVLAWQAPQGGLYLVDGDESLFVDAAPLPNVTPGSRIEAVGYPALNVRFAPIVQDAVTRVVGAEKHPEPRAAEPGALANGSLDAALVKVRARFIEGYQQPGVWKTTWKTEDGSPLIFDAILSGKHPSNLERDTVADLTGIVHTLMNDERNPVDMDLFLRTPADIAVISTPGWWTAKRIWRIVGVLVFVLAASVAWVLVLRRKIEQQTSLVKLQLAKEEELQRQYRGLFDNNPHPMWVYDPKTLKFLAVNETAVQRYGYSREEFLSMVATDIRPADERERFTNFLKSCGRGAQEAVIWQHQRKDGSRISVEITARSITFAGLDARLVLAHDITARLEAERALRLSEAKFRRLVDSSLIGIVFFNGEGVITDANDCFLAMVGRTHEELRSGKLKSSDFAPADRLPRHERAMQHLRTHGMAAATRREVMRRDGTRSPAMVGAVSLDGTDGYVAFVLDLTKETTLEQQVVLAQKMEAVGLLAGGVAHDFNNLLQVIEGYTLLSLEMLDSKATELRENLQNVHSASERAAELTRQLLVFSRQENLKEADMDVAESLAETLKLVRRVIGEHIEVKFTTAPNLAHIRADKGRIEQVLMNLCLNARDAMPKGGALTIDLSNATLMEGDGAPVGQVGGPYVCIRVTDTGCGMDSATLARIYEPFFTTKSKEKGSGLGLSIVYGIVERHKGVIRVHSKVGAGTTFVVYFPAVTSSGETKITSKKPEIADKGGMETILLVEDEPAVRMLAARVLTRAGYDVREAADGAEACDLFKEHAPDIDLVLMDVIMPKMGGRDAYENIVKTRSDVPVIFCSGYSERELGAEFLQSHGLDLLPKPYRPDELLTRVRARLHPHESQA